MDEIPAVAINGLTVKGVTFHDTLGATYNAPNGGQLTYVQDPTILGPVADVVTIDLPFPATVVSFGLALNTSTLALPATGGTVQLFGAGLTPLGSFPVTLTLEDPFAEGIFVSPADVAGITRLVVSFNTVSGAPQFGLDNLVASTFVNGLASDAFAVRFASNLNIGDSFVNVTNTGASAIIAPWPIRFQAGNLCINTYVFDQAEEMLACCSCFVTPNGLSSFSVKNQLISNNLTPEIPNSVVIKLLATTGALAISGETGGLNSCNAGVQTSAANLASGMRAWGTTLHALPTTPVTYGVNETAFSRADLSQAEINHLTAFCAFIQSNGSGFGICRGCSVGGLGATTVQ